MSNLYKVERILDIKQDRKWYEIWFENRDPIIKDSPANYDVSCKRYMLDELVDTPELARHILRHGWVGLWVAWGEKPLAVAIYLGDLTIPWEKLEELKKESNRQSEVEL